MRRRLSLWILSVCTVVMAVACAPARPNFAGTWVFDPEATKAAADAAKVNGLALFLEQFDAEQTADAYTMKVNLGPMIVTAIYKLDGSDSKNVSPPATPGQPEIEVHSRAQWDGAALVVTSTSTSPGENGPIEVKSTRKFSLDPKGRLLIERSGTPAAMVPTTRSVYTKKK